ncbi:MAG: YCF48-related protein [Geobacteraceae bacterium]
MLIKRTIGIIISALPLLIIGALLYVAIYIKPQPEEAKTNPYPIVKRDRFYGVVSPTPTTVWAVGSHGKVVRSNDAGNSWVVQTTPTTEHLQDIATWDDKRACAVGNNGVVMVTSDGGTSWKSVEAPRSDLANKFVAVRVFPDGGAWVVGEMGAVLYSKDFGLTWERRLKQEDVAWNSIALIEKTGFLVGEAGRIMRTDNGGETWTAVKSPVVSSLMGVALRDKDNGVAVGLQGVVLITKDGGKSWTETSKATIEHLFDIIWDGTEWIAVGDKGVMLKGDSSGADWNGKRITDLDTSWYTKVAKSGNRYYLSGARLAVLEKGDIKFFDKKI